jgi:1-acyl-sn-glycerol-3-phosphate acyltransferase
VLYRLMHAVLPPLLRGIWRPEVRGLDHVPATGGVLLASNHLSFVDSVAIPAVVPRPVTFLAKAEYWTGSGVKGFASRAFFEGLGMLPVDRDDSRAALESLDLALGVLSAGGAFGIYPEGTRSRDGRLYRGRTGVAHLALTAGVPIVPVGLRGTEHVMPVGSSRPRRVPVGIEFGVPIDPAGRYDGVPLGRARRELTDEVMAAIRELTGQEYAGAYNERPPD